MSRAHFEAGVAGHSGPLYNLSMGEGHPLAIDTGVFRGAVGRQSNEVKPFKAKSGETFTGVVTKSYTDPTESSHSVTMHPEVQSWEANPGFNDPGSGVSRWSDHLQGTLFTPANITHQTQAGTLHVQERARHEEEVWDEDLGDYLHPDEMPKQATVALAATRPEYRRKGLATETLRISHDYLKKRGVELVADAVRTDMGAMLGRAAAREDPHAKNDRGEYLSDEVNPSTVGPMANTGVDEVPQDQQFGGSLDVRERTAQMGKEDRTKIESERHQQVGSQMKAAGEQLRLPLGDHDE